VSHITRHAAYHNSVVPRVIVAHEESAPEEPEVVATAPEDPDAAEPSGPDAPSPEGQAPPQQPARKRSARAGGS